MKNIFDDAGRAVGQAFSNVQRAFNVETDPEVRFYDTLKEKDFDNIRAMYGDETVVSYVKAMESKKLRRKV